MGEPTSSNERSKPSRTEDRDHDRDESRSPRRPTATTNTTTNATNTTNTASSSTATRRRDSAASATAETPTSTNAETENETEIAAKAEAESSPVKATDAVASAAAEEQAREAGEGAGGGVGGGESLRIRSSFVGSVGSGASGASSAGKIDREKVCPFLLRTFCKFGGHHALGDYSMKALPVKDEIQIYTWKDATIREIGNLVKAAFREAASEPNVRMALRLVFRNNDHDALSKDLGQVNPGRPITTHEERSLADLRFEIGDYLDVAIYTNERRGGGDGVPTGPGGYRNGQGFQRGGGPDRSRGFGGAGGPAGGWGGSSSRVGGGGGGAGPPNDFRRDRPAFGGGQAPPDRNGPGSGANDWGRGRRDKNDGGFAAGGPDRRGSDRRGNARFDPYQRGR